MLSSLKKKNVLSSFASKFNISVIVLFKDKYFGFENGQYHEGVGISPPWVCHPIGVYLAEGATLQFFTFKKNPENEKFGFEI